jgi:hypothetical protein
MRWRVFVGDSQDPTDKRFAAMLMAVVMPISAEYEN